MNHIEQIEKSFKVDQVLSDGEQAWPLLRIYYYFHLRNLENRSNRPLSVYDSKKKWQRALDLFRGLHRLPLRKEFLCFSDSSENKLIEGQLRNKLFFQTFEHLGHSHFQYFERSDAKITRDLPDGNPSTISSSALDILAHLFAPFLSSPKIENQNVLRDIQAANGIIIDDKKFLRLFKAYRIVMKALLKWKRPRIVFLSDYYNFRNMALVRECKTLAIPTIEFQHGVINATHPAYNFYGGTWNRSYLPDYLYGFGPMVLSEIGPTSFLPKEQICNIGHPYLDFLRRHPADPALNPYSGKTSCLVTLQWTDQKQVIEFIAGLAPSLPQIHFFLLPRNWDSAYYRQFRLPENVSFERNLDFYKAVQYCDIHVTTYSTTALEAAFFEKPNILIDFDQMASTYFARLLPEDAMNRYIKTAESFCSSVANLGDHSSKGADENQLFSLKYQENLARNLATHLSL